MRPFCVTALATGFAIGISVSACGSDSRSPNPNLEPVNPNALKFMALTEEDLDQSYRVTDNRFVFPEEAEDLDVPSGWATAYLSNFEAETRATMPVDEIGVLLELYVDATSIEDATELSDPVFAESERFDPGIGEVSVGYGVLAGPEGERRPLYIVRFQRGPIIGMVKVKGSGDLSEEQAQDTVTDYARVLDDRIDSVLKSPPLSPAPP